MSKNWSSTLRLPKFTIPPRLVPADRSALIRATTDDLYAWQSTARPLSASHFTLHDGPPYANGPLHVGHALNKILKDMILRVAISSGARVTYRPGWDCHGLPIELKALEKSGAQPGTLRAPEIRRAARMLAIETVEKQMRGFREMGIMADWEGRWTTMDTGFEIAQLRLFQQMVECGLIVRRNKPVYWSVSSQTALAEAELEYQENHVSHAAYVRFPIATLELNRKLGLPENEKLYAVIWTTTPWTLPANRAIAVHEELPYTVLQVNGDLLLVASNRVSAVSEWFPPETPIETVKADIPGSEIVGATYVHKMRPAKTPPYPIIHAPFVTADSGTGLVHLAPGHGMEDYDVCKPFNLEVVAPITDDGHFTAEAYPDHPELLTSAPSIIDGGGKAVVDIMNEDVIKTHRFKHKYPYDWRTKKPVVTRATAQWFADVASIKDAALSSLSAVTFIPTGGKKRLESFIKGRSEWCISRQRAWGVPIPALYDASGNAIVTPESVAHIIATIEQRGTDAWFSDSETEPAWIPPSLRDSGQICRGKDTMDVWFDSGSSWTQTEGPADVYLEGSDQHRGWFQSSLLTRVAAAHAANQGPVAPFKQLITHGFTLDKQAAKMSKSLGNVITPEQIMSGTLLPPVKQKKTAENTPYCPKHENFGPDALHLWVAASEYTKDIAVSPTVLKAVHASMNKYRTILRMLTGSLHPASLTAPVSLLDRIALIQLDHVLTTVYTVYQSHEFFRAVATINHYISVDLSAFYLESLKDRLYCGDGGGVLLAVFRGLTRMLAPITPLLVEEAWRGRPAWMFETFPGDLSPARQLFTAPVVESAWLATTPVATDGIEMTTDVIKNDMPLLFSVHTAVKAALESARIAKVLGSSLQSHVVVVPSSPEKAARLRRYEAELDALFVVSGVEIVEGGTKGKEINSEDGAWAFEGAFSGGVVVVLPPRGAKCGRCWRFVAEEGKEICPRCAKIVKI